MSRIKRKMRCRGCEKSFNPRHVLQTGFCKKCRDKRKKAADRAAQEEARAKRAAEIQTVPSTTATRVLEGAAKLRAEHPDATITMNVDPVTQEITYIIEEEE